MNHHCLANLLLYKKQRWDFHCIKKYVVTSNNGVMTSLALKGLTNNNKFKSNVSVNDILFGTPYCFHLTQSAYLTNLFLISRNLRFSLNNLVKNQNQIYGCTHGRITSCHCASHYNKAGMWSEPPSSTPPLVHSMKWKSNILSASSASTWFLLSEKIYIYLLKMMFSMNIIYEILLYKMKWDQNI